MPWRIDRYLVREILPPFFLAVLAFLVFIGLELVISLSDTVLARGAGALELLRLVAYKLPTLFSFALPAAVLLATFLALGRLAGDRELLAFQTVGFSLRRVTVPFILFGALASGAAFFLGEYAVPPAEAAYRREYLNLLYRGAPPRVQEAVFFRGLQGETYYLEKIEQERVSGVLVYDQTGRILPVEGRFPTVITAKEGRFSGGTLELWGGRVLRFSPEGALAEVVRFERLTLEVGEELRRAVIGGKTPSEMSVRELGQRIELLRRSGLDPRSLVVEYHAKLALSAAAFVFVLFGAPLGALLGRRGRATGAIVGFVLVAAAQGLFVWARSMAQRGLIPPFLGGWLPHMGFAALGLVLLVTLDRLRLRGLLPLVFLVGLTTTGTPPPFRQLEAEEIWLEQNAQALKAIAVRLELEDYTLEAASLQARQEPPGWTIEAQDASLKGKDGEWRAGNLRAFLTAEGQVRTLSGDNIRGTSVFRGPEKQETLYFEAQWGEATFERGELARVEGKHVEFTTCPCLSGAPYRVWAEEFVLLAQQWLYARSITIRSFDLEVLWLPVYVARLGEESSPLFPQIGWTGDLLYLRWAFPLSFGEGTAGAVGLTWYPTAWRVEPSLVGTWPGGNLSLSLTGMRAQLQGRGPLGPWRASLSWTGTALSANVRGETKGWSWALAWGRMEKGDFVYETAPELTLSSRGRQLGGDLSLQVSGGLYREGQTASQRVSLALSWSGRQTWGDLTFAWPWDVRLDLYRDKEKAAVGASPSLQLGAFSLGYSGRWTYGRSPFAFDTEVPTSQLTLGASLRSRGWRLTLTSGWNFQAGDFLPLRGTVSGPGLSSEWSFTLSPLTFLRARAAWTWKGGGASLTVEGGARNNPWRWDDLVVRGLWTGERIGFTGGLRVGLAPLRLLRWACTGEWGPAEDWIVRVGLEYDGPTGRIVQWETGVSRLFVGCLRVGVAAGSGGIVFQVEVPAFPQAKIRFAPLDEGLRLGE